MSTVKKKKTKRKKFLDVMEDIIPWGERKAWQTNKRNRKDA